MSPPANAAALLPTLGAERMQEFFKPRNIIIRLKEEEKWGPAQREALYKVGAALCCTICAQHAIAASNRHGCAGKWQTQLQPGTRTLARRAWSGLEWASGAR